jgi:endonuclease/exonuclease/phosphatase (EEP) superfamily protein YafD
MKKESPGFFSLFPRPQGLLTAAGVVTCAATLFGFLGRFSWFLDLFSHFRVQYLIGLAILGALLLVMRRRKTAIMFLGFACVNLLLILPLYFGGRNTLPQGGHNTLRAMLLNVNTRLGDSERVKRVIRDADPDILVLEEISSQWMADLAWLTNSHPYCLTQPREDNFGIGLFSKFPLAESVVAYIGSAEVPSILATINTGQTNLRVIATHPLPPVGRGYSRWRNEQLDQLPEHVQSSLPLILLGDLNISPWSYHFRRLLKRTELRDSSQGYGVQPTWPNYNPLLRIPIDHCLHSMHIVIIDRSIGPDVSSDHYPVIIDFAITDESTEKVPTRQIQRTR